MDSQTKELIAIGAAVGANCMPCLAFHLDKAKEHGAKRKELIIAAKIGLHVKAGATEKMEQYVAKLLTGFDQQHVDDICRCE